MTGRSHSHSFLKIAPGQTDTVADPSPPRPHIIACLQSDPRRPAQAWPSLDHDSPARLRSIADIATGLFPAGHCGEAR